MKRRDSGSWRPPPDPEAIRMASEARGGIDLILMDIDLGPGMDGTEAAREILTRHDIPVVFLSSHTEQEVVNKTEKITSYGYVVKNAGITVLTASIRMAFRLFEAYDHISRKNSEIETMNEELNATIEEMEATNEELLRSQEEILGHEKALQESYEKNQALLDATPDLIFIMDRKGVFLEFKGPVDSLALKPELFLGKKIHDTLPSIADLIMGKITDLFDNGGIQIAEYSMEFQGELRSYEARMVKMDTGRAVAIVRDVTVNKKKEQELSDSREILQGVINAAPFGSHSYLLDEDGSLIFISANRSADLILGVDHRQFIGKKIEEAFPALISTEVPGAYRQVALTGTAYDTEQIEYNEQGISGAFEVHGIRTGDRMMTAFFRDITERKKADLALVESEKKYRFLVENMTDVVWKLSPDFRFTYVSQGIEKMSGHRPDEMVGRPATEIMTPRSAEVVIKGALERLEQMRQGKKPDTWVVQVENVAKDGRIIWTEVISQPVYDETGALAGYQGVTRDIHKRKEVRESAQGIGDEILVHNQRRRRGDSHRRDSHPKVHLCQSGHMPDARLCNRGACRHVGKRYPSPGTSPPRY